MSGSAGRLDPRQRRILGIASLASFMISLDSLVVSTALPTIHGSLHATLASLEWTVNAYNLSFAVLLLTGAAVSDRFGRKRLFVIGLGVFTAASAVCAMAPNVNVLIAARAFQGVGSAFVMPVALTLVSAAVSPEQRGRALGIFISVSGLATFLGPVVGGALAEEASWNWIFWLNVPIGLVGILLVVKGIEESRGPSVRLDLGGVFMATASAFGVVWALVRGNGTGWGSYEVVGSLMGGLLFALAFVLWERKVEAPMLPVRFFRIRTFSAANIASFFMFAEIYGVNFMLAQFLQNSQHYGPLGAGVRMIPLTIGVLLFAPTAGTLISRYGQRRLVGFGLLFHAVALALVATLVSPTMHLLEWAVPLFIGGAGSVYAIPAAQRAVVNAVPPTDIGKASGAVTMMRYLGGVFGIAILSAAFAANGSYATPQSFADGFRIAMFMAAGFAFVGGAAGLAIPGQVKSTSTKPAPAALESVSKTA